MVIQSEFHIIKSNNNYLQLTMLLRMGQITYHHIPRLYKKEWNNWEGLIFFIFKHSNLQSLQFIHLFAKKPTIRRVICPLIILTTCISFSIIVSFFEIKVFIRVNSCWYLLKCLNGQLTHKHMG